MSRVQKNAGQRSPRSTARRGANSTGGDPTDKNSTRKSSAGKNPTRKDSATKDPAVPEVGQHRWTFLSNHAHVLICLARDPDIRLREISAQIGITERAVIKIVADLEEEGLIRRHREGRRNSYELSLDQPLRHPIEANRTVGELVKLILG